MAKPATKRAPAKTRVVEASMAAGGGTHIGSGLLLDPRAIERAMGKATEAALAKGITDPDKILKAKLAARDQVKAEFRQAEAKHLAKIQASAEKKGHG